MKMCIKSFELQYIDDVFQLEELKETDSLFPYWKEYVKYHPNATQFFYIKDIMSGTVPYLNELSIDHILDIIPPWFKMKDIYLRIDIGHNEIDKICLPVKKDEYEFNYKNRNPILDVLRENNMIFEVSQTDFFSLYADK